MDQTKGSIPDGIAKEQIKHGDSKKQDTVQQKAQLQPSRGSNAPQKSSSITSGKQIQDFYVTNQNLGKGSYGSVCIAYRLSKEGKKIGKYAAKVIQLSELNDKEIVQLTREIEILQQIRHQNIVRLEHVTRTKNNLYIFLEYVKDGDFRNVLDARRRLHQSEALSFFKQICEAFKELYKRNIIHRDIKPENILIDQTEKGPRLLVSDFGFARVLSQDQMNKKIEQTPVGSLKYMAPQILSIMSFSCKCDIWSLGIVIYEFLYGFPPWLDDTYKRLLNKILAQPLVFPTNIKVSQDLQDLLKRMITIDEDQRISWDDLFLHPLLNDNSELYSTFNVCDQYVTESIVSVREYKDQQVQIYASIIEGGSEEEEENPRLKEWNFLRSLRQQMLMITSVINDIVRFKTQGLIVISSILLHKTLLLLQKQQQIVREHIQELLKAEDLDEKEQKQENDSEIIAHYSSLNQNDDDSIMPFFIQLFQNSSKYIEKSKEESFILLVKQRLTFSHTEFLSVYEQTLTQFIIEFRKSVSNKQNRYSTLLESLIAVISCYEKNYSFKSPMSLEQLEQKINSFIKQIAPDSMLKSESEINEALDSLQISVEAKAQI